ncbi:MAG: TRZ/ATZ family hydrolase, partial [Gammaproteobacteria bacterium]
MNNKYLILKPKWLLTVNPAFEVLDDYAVVIKGSCIQSLLPAAEVHEQDEYRDADIIELPDHVLMPGLVNSHTHASMSLFRGIADDLALT